MEIDFQWIMRESGDGEAVEEEQECRATVSGCEGGIQWAFLCNLRSTLVAL